MQPHPTLLWPLQQPPALALPRLPAQNTHGNRSWPPDISSSRCGCWAPGVSMGTAGPGALPCHSCPHPALSWGQHQAVTAPHPPPAWDTTEQHHLGWGLPWHHPPWLGFLPVPGEKGTAPSLTLRAPRLFSSGQSGGPSMARSRAQALGGRGWVQG